MSTLARDRPSAVAGAAIIAATALAYVVRMAFFDQGLLGVAAAPLAYGLLLLAGAIGAMEVTASPGNPLPGLVGPLACLYLLLQWFGSRALDVGWTPLESMTSLGGLQLACLVSYLGCAALSLCVASIRRGLRIPRVAFLIAVGCCAGPTLLLEGGAASSELLRDRVPPRNALSVWLFIACVFLLIVAATLARPEGSHDASSISRLRFGGMFLGAVAVALAFSVQLNLLRPGPGSVPLLGGMILLLASGVILCCASVAKRALRRDLGGARE